MPTNVDIQINVQPTGFSPSANPVSLTVDAIDDLTIDLDAGTMDRAVTIQPAAADNIEFILVAPLANGAAVSYRTNLAAAMIPLGSTHLYVGRGMAALLGANPTILYLSNAEANPVGVRVVVGRRV